MIRATASIAALSFAMVQAALTIAPPLAAQAPPGPRFEVASLKERNRSVPGTGMPAPESPLPSLPAALRERFGLELRSDTGPVEVLVIDRAERPTPN